MSKSLLQDVAWHSLPADEAAARLTASFEQGLDDAEVACRRSQHGENRLTPAPSRGPLVRFALQFVQPLVLVLVLAGLVTAVLGEWVDAAVIFGVTLVNAVIGFIQEGRAASALAALARSVISEVTVLRGGCKQRLSSTELVPGDVVLLAAGDRVPADLRLFRAKDLQAIEAALTGESTAVAKGGEALPAGTLLAERCNMAYAGTVMISGQGAGVVVATGDHTETGRISRLIAETPDLTTPLTRRMAIFSNWLLLAIGLLAGLTFTVGMWRGESAFAMFMAAVALAVGAIPEGLPAAMTITLAIGVSRMARRRAIIRKLPAVETLGSTTVICSDKTGTLTENQMTVREIYAGGVRTAVSGSGYSPTGMIGDGGDVAGALRECLLAGALCNDAGLSRSNRHWEIVGDPTEGALLVVARKAGLDERTLQKLFPRLDEIPFDSARQYMATLHDIDGARVAYFKGALEQLLSRSLSMLDRNGRSVSLRREQIEGAAATMAAAGLRVLAVARLAAASESSLTPTSADAGLEFVGLMGMVDPPRPKAIAAVRTCHAAGITVKMITGDHATTALSIARQMGIAKSGETAISGRELAALGDESLREVVRRINVFARVEPAQKLRLVRALQANGEVVAMTGDGVNDAPALKQADIGIAMGLGGTEVAKDAAEMVLTDDDFAAIEAAVEEGRGVYDNLVKFITWTLPTNFGEGLVIVAAILAGATLPITPLQILWINMTTAVFLGLMLAFEPIEHAVMRRPPRPPGTPILDAALVWRIVLVSLLLLAGSFGLFLRELAQGHSLAEARTVAVNVFVVVEGMYLFNCRSLKLSALRLGLFSNPAIWYGIAVMALLQAGLTYLPLMNRLFATAPIGWREWLEIGAVGVVAYFVVGVEKRLRALR
ncbi:MAG: putative cation-transporting ATPase F [Candidatus Accumulibacter sp. BA-94]|uniref:HAD-IC family P-type ATPase n=1 Tax=Accumulibacter sp. TaxID=2053492 RepID=UPI00044D34DC|nr:HAD-IC family P-type ATPase [Accumulibacter sp.]EXI91966.1 MAG: putative cation-transporting ATPase F [Candidatus Accumulibacter sp. BA-94]MBL8392059.1 HAD-IC family P-type ATPase [Accumulibacter sp.]HRD87166.1 HAD-IC family P-type ATPase [Accumulibacter sp.]